MPNPTLQDAIHNWQADEGQTDATMLTGQLEVIAEELRTANLIALHAAMRERRDNENASELLTQIFVRLGFA